MINNSSSTHNTKNTSNMMNTKRMAKGSIGNNVQYQISRNEIKEMKCCQTKEKEKVIVAKSRLRIQRADYCYQQQHKKDICKYVWRF